MLPLLTIFKLSKIGEIRSFRIKGPVTFVCYQEKTVTVV